MNRSPSYFVLSRITIVVAWVVIGLALVHPAQGTGLSICFIHFTTDLPCPGCGLTRSVSCAARGMMTESLDYHPLGALILVLLCLVAFVSLLPQPRRDALRRFLDTHGRTTRIVYAVFVAAFLLHGVGRAVLIMATDRPWP